MRNGVINSVLVVVGMSGGVDSSVAAALLKQQGYDVVGMTMCFSLPDPRTKKPRCCGLEGIEDARRVAHKLGIKHYVLNMQKALDERVIKDFCREYLQGRTPNPCIRCNQYLKFDILLKKAISLGARYLATGHYARIISHKKMFLLKKARDLKKDQSYFLYRLNQQQLKHIIFPLGDLLKKEVRGLARKFNLPVSDKPASQEICFLPTDDYRDFLRSRLPAEKIKPGPIVDSAGNVLGEHQGTVFYTIGQRQGLGIAKGYPIYISGIDPKNNRLTVANKEGACKKEFRAKSLHFITEPEKKKFAAGVKIRYNHREAAAEVSIFARKAKVKFIKPQFAVTPGQAAVFYSRDKVLGGGIIEKALD